MERERRPGVRRAGWTRPTHALRRWAMPPLLGILALFLTAVPAPAERLLVKMATLAPEGSSMYLILKEMGEKWKAASGGRVILRLYGGGVAGDEADVVRKMRLGTLNAGSMGTSGLADIEPWVLALQVPMMFASYEEFDYVLERMAPKLEGLFSEKGFVVLHWADAGWVHFFSKAPIRTPDDLKRLKLFTWGSEPAVVEIWKAAGFSPVPLPSTELATALQTGLVNALPTSPQAALLLQWFHSAKNMVDVRWGILFGGTIVTKADWEKIPEELRGAMLAAAREAGAKMREEARRGAVPDIEAMQKRGLSVVHVDPQTEALWRQAAEAAYPKIRSSYVPPPAFDEAIRLRDEYRKKAGATAR